MSTIDVIKTDINGIKNILYHPDIIDGILQGQIINLSNINPNIIPYLTFYKITVDRQDAAITCFFNGGETHVADFGVIKKFRGKIAKDIAYKVLRKYLYDKEKKEVVAKISHSNTPSLHFACWVGFKPYESDNEHIYLRYIHGKCNKQSF